MGNLDEAAALGVMHMRVANMEVPDCEMAEVIFELSGAMEIMDQTDVESFTKCHADVGEPARGEGDLRGRVQGEAARFA